MTLYARRLTRILISLGRLREGERIVIRRTRAGRHLLAMGGWRWWAETDNGRVTSDREVCGSQWRLSEILKAPYIAVVDNGGGCELVPEEGTRKGDKDLRPNPLIVAAAAALVGLLLATTAHAQFPPTDNILAPVAQEQPTDDEGGDAAGPATKQFDRSGVEATSGSGDDGAATAAPAPPVRVAMGTACPVYSAPPGESDMRCDVLLGVSLRPESWRRLPRLHPFVGVGSKSLVAGVAWAASDKYAFGVGAMALREDYLDVGTVAPCVAFTVSIGGGE